MHLVSSASPINSESSILKISRAIHANHRTNCTAIAFLSQIPRRLSLKILLSSINKFFSSSQPQHYNYFSHSFTSSKSDYHQAQVKHLLPRRDKRTIPYLAIGTHNMWCDRHQLASDLISICERNPPPIHENYSTPLEPTRGSRAHSHQAKELEPNSHRLTHVEHHSNHKPLWLESLSPIKWHLNL
jgi:hypothetical protein